MSEAPLKITKTNAPALIGIKKKWNKKRNWSTARFRPKSNIPLSSPEKLLEIIKKIQNEKLNLKIDISSSLDHLKAAEENFDEHCVKLKQEMLEWVEKYMENYKITKLREIQNNNQLMNKAYDSAVEECLQLNRLVTATEHSINIVHSIDSLLLKKIEKWIQKYDINNFEAEKQVTLLTEQNLNELDDLEIRTNINGYLAKNDGNIHSPMSCTNKYNITSFDHFNVLQDAKISQNLAGNHNKYTGKG